MPLKRRRRLSPMKPSTHGRITQRLARLETVVDQLTRSRVNVRREEHDAVLAALKKVEQNAADLERHTRDLDVQFKRIAQVQADLDEIKRAWTRVKAT
jgi:ribosome-associated translation inhibitor RaiA